MLIDGEKWACEACVRGHRVTTCKHHDRPLIRINRKGRPFSTCSVCHHTPCPRPDEHSKLKREAEAKTSKSSAGRPRRRPSFLPIAPRPVVAAATRGSPESSGLPHLQRDEVSAFGYQTAAGDNGPSASSSAVSQSVRSNPSPGGVSSYMPSCGSLASPPGICSVTDIPVSMSSMMSGSLAAEGGLSLDEAFSLDALDVNFLDDWTWLSAGEAL